MMICIVVSAQKVSKLIDPIHFIAKIIYRLNGIIDAFFNVNTIHEVELLEFPSNVLYVSRLNPTVFNINAILYCCFYVYYELNNHSVSNIPLKLNNGKAITVDVAFGGGYYAVLPAEMVDFQFGVHSIKQLAGLGREIEEKLNNTLKIVHPTIPEISYIYGVMFTDYEQLASKNVSKHCAIFAGGQIDRSPCGSGTTACMALLFQRKLARLGQTVKFHSAVNDSVFTAAVKDSLEWQGKSSVIIEIKGQAFYSGQSTFVLEDEDPLGFGFDVE